MRGQESMRARSFQARDHDAPDWGLQVCFGGAFFGGCFIAEMSHCAALFVFDRGAVRASA
jgi:hypothetical protein